MEPKKRFKASMPPADAPMPTTGGLACFPSAGSGSVFRVNSTILNGITRLDIRRLLTFFES
jgi:hypothetical protein